MRKTFNYCFLVIALVFAFSVSSFAIEKARTINISKDLIVNGTLVKKGEYKVKFDSQTNEVWILEGKKMVAKSPAKIVERDFKARTSELRISEETGSTILKGITFPGETRTIVLENDTPANPQ